MTEHLVPEYHRARLVVVVCAALVLLWWLGIPFEGTIPLINVKLPDDARLPYVLACLLAYGLLRLIIEWAQSEPERRRRRASKIDLTLTLSIGGAATWALATRILPPFEFPAVPLLPSFAVIMLGIASGELLNNWFLNLFLIRSKEEARRLALPRIPVAVRASFRMGYVVLPALSQPVEVIQAEAANEAALSFIKKGKPYWSHIGRAGVGNTHFTWLLAGTLPDWRGTPLVLVVALEENNISLAERIGENLLNAGLGQ